jgi:hypothetical protein
MRCYRLGFHARRSRCAIAPPHLIGRSEGSMWHGRPALGRCSERTDPRDDVFEKRGSQWLLVPHTASIQSGPSAELSPILEKGMPASHLPQAELTTSRRTLQI